MFASANEFYKSFLKAPNIDFKALVDLQERNLEAIMAMNAKLVEGAQDLVRRQNEMVEMAVRESLETLRHSLDGNGGAVSLDRQFDFLKSSAEKTVANLRELAEAAGKTGSEAAEIWRRRATESVGEISALVKTAA